MLLKQGKLYQIKPKEELYLYSENFKIKPFKVNEDASLLFLYEEPIETVWEGSSPVLKYVYKCYFLIDNTIYYCLDTTTDVLIEIR